MAHHQLLLLALSVVVVGIAGALGVRAFAENRRAADADAVVAGLVRVGTEAQAWKGRPAVLGGGASAEGFDGVEAVFERLGWAPMAWPAVVPGGPAPGVGGKKCYGPPGGPMYYCPVVEAGGPLVVYAVSEALATAAAAPGPAVVAVATVSGTSADEIATDLFL